MTSGAVTGIILAGGESRRMGEPKPWVIYRGKPLITWVFDALKPLCSEMLIIANSGDFSALPARVIPDNYPGYGPAAGIEAGLSGAAHSLALVCSCDTPNLTTGVFSWLLEKHGDYDISIASHGGITEPLIGVFSRPVRDAFRKAILAGNAHPPRIIRSCRWQEVPVPEGENFSGPDLFLNLNTPDDVKK